MTEDNNVTPRQKVEEQILIRITGRDRPGLTASIMGILAKYDAQILDIGQADIHSTLSLGILIRIDDSKSGFAMKELLFKATELGVNKYAVASESFSYPLTALILSSVT